MLTVNDLQGGFEAWRIGVWKDLERSYAFERESFGMAFHSIDALTKLKCVKPRRL